MSQTPPSAVQSAEVCTRHPCESGAQISRMLPLHVTPGAMQSVVIGIDASPERTGIIGVAGESHPVSQITDAINVNAQADWRDRGGMVPTV